MAIFSGKIIEAHYIDLEYSLIEILYEGEDGKLYSHAIRVDPDHPDYQALLEEGWDQDKIIDDTAEYKRRTSASFNTEVNAAAKLLVDEILAQERESLIKKSKALDEKGKSLDEKGRSIEDLDRSTRLKMQDVVAEVWTHLYENNENKDMLFKLKLWVLEQEFINAATKEEKSEIRKAKRATEVFGLIDKFLIEE